MPTFITRLVAGGKPPYDTWTFIVVPAAVHRALGGKARTPVRGTVAGVTFRATVHKGEGVQRFAVGRQIRDASGAQVGDRVEVELEVDADERALEVPGELRDVLDQDQLWCAFDALAPSCRRAWAQHVGEARKAETRVRRAAKAKAAILARRYPGER